MSELGSTEECGRVLMANLLQKIDSPIAHFMLSLLMLTLEV